ncbi:integrase [Xenorhabdus sp. TS4]|uniref:Integrase n=1 Tax=Xenorhabdus ehlersii TaxID=290111 RepID=A0A2D0IWQ2_9GAMM|nr:integrase [Xenorhabdus sp. TS4]PHM26325.1 integrase [Xenorhabdus ehlersii]
MTFLAHEEIKLLLNALSGDYKLVALLCLSTGARWSEAATLKSEQVINGGNIIALQQILGHASIQQTTVYAHLLPDYMQFASTLNPLKGGIGV